MAAVENVLNIRMDERGGRAIYVVIADAVRESVALGDSAPGAKLPSESASAKQLGVNRLTVSRAYDDLRDTGIIVQRRGSGTYITAGASRQARHRGKRRIRMLAVIIGENTLSECQRQNLFIATDILDGVREVLGGRETEIRFLKSFTRPCVESLPEADAVLIHHTDDYDTSLAGELLQRGVPVISTWDEKPWAGVPHVDYDRHESAELATWRLVECGHRRIGFIGLSSPRPWPLSAKFAVFTSVSPLLGIARPQPSLR